MKVKDEVLEPDAGGDGFQSPTVESSSSVSLTVEPVVENMEFKVEVAENWNVPTLEVISSIKAELGSEVTTQEDSCIQQPIHPEYQQDEDDDDGSWGEDVDNDSGSDYDPNKEVDPRPPKKHRPGPKSKTSKPSSVKAPNPTEMEKKEDSDSSGYEFIVKYYKCQVCSKMFKDLSSCKLHEKCHKAGHVEDRQHSQENNLLELVRVHTAFSNIFHDIVVNKLKPPDYHNPPTPIIPSCSSRPSLKINECKDPEFQVNDSEGADEDYVYKPKTKRRRKKSCRKRGGSLEQDMNPNQESSTDSSSINKRICLTSVKDNYESSRSLTMGNNIGPMQRNDFRSSSSPREITDKEFTCRECGSEEFGSKMSLYQHRKTAHGLQHPSKASHTCQVCGKHFTKLSDAISHERIHKHENSYRYKTVDEVIENLKKFPIVYFQCLECNSFLKSKERLLLHKNNHHDLKSENESVDHTIEEAETSSFCKIQFPECLIMLSKDNPLGKKSTSESDDSSVPTSGSESESTASASSDSSVCILSDVETEKPEPVYITVTDSDEEDADDDPIESEEPEFFDNSSTNAKSSSKSSCSSGNEDMIICDASALVATTFKSSFTCETCGKVFSSEAVFKRHVRLHDTDTSLVCCICDSVMPTPDALLVHYEQHKNGAPDKPSKSMQKPVNSYSCHLCDRTFSKQIGLKVHLKIHQNCTKPRKVPVSQRPSTPVSVPIQDIDNDKAVTTKGDDVKPNIVDQDVSIPVEMDVEYPVSMKVEDDLPCILCDLKFSSSHELIHHYRVHQNQDNGGASTSIAPDDVVMSELNDEPISSKSTTSITEIGTTKDNDDNDYNLVIDLDPEEEQDSDISNSELTIVNSYSIPSTPATPTSAQNSPSAEIEMEIEEVVQEPREEMPRRASTLSNRSESNSESFRCIECKAQFLTESNLDNHLREMHPKSNAVLALGNEDVFSAWDSSLKVGTRRRWKLEESNLPITDPISGMVSCFFPRCRKMFSTDQDSMNHCKRSHKYMHTCVLCPFKTGYKHSLETHYKGVHLRPKTPRPRPPSTSDFDVEKHSEEPEIEIQDSGFCTEDRNNGLFKCTFPMCGRRFGSFPKVQRHHRLHKIYKCGKCDRAFYLLRPLLAHLITHKVVENSSESSAQGPGNDSGHVDETSKDSLTAAAGTTSLAEDQEIETIDISDGEDDEEDNTGEDKNRTPKTVFICTKCGAELKRGALAWHVDKCDPSPQSSSTSISKDPQILHQPSSSSSLPNGIVEIEFSNIKTKLTNDKASRRLVCPVRSCSQIFKGKKGAEFHQWKVHKNTCFCPGCGDWFLKTHFQRIHMKICSPEIMRKQQEDTAQYIRSMSISTRRTSQEVTPIMADDSAQNEQFKEVTCSFCDVLLTSEEALQAHMAEAHGYAPITYSCSICKEVCSDRDVLLAHIAKRHPPNPPPAPEVIDLSDDLPRPRRSNRHLYLSVPTNPTLRSSLSLRPNGETLNLPSQPQADSIERDFGRRLGAMIRQIDQGNRESPIVGTNLQPVDSGVSTFIPLGESRIEVPSTSQGGAHLNLLPQNILEREISRIMQKQKEAVSKELSTPGFARCSTCKVSFLNASILREHLKKYHPRFMCNFCYVEFTDSGELEIHMRQEHKEGVARTTANSMISNAVAMNLAPVSIFSCRFCELRFDSGSNLKAHVSQVHSIQVGVSRPSNSNVVQTETQTSSDLSSILGI